MTPSSEDMLRIFFTTVRTQSCGAWLMLSRKILAPARIRARSFSGESVAGPRVQMILVFRMGDVGLMIRLRRAQRPRVNVGGGSKSIPRVGVW